MPSTKSSIPKITDRGAIKIPISASTRQNSIPLKQTSAQISDDTSKENSRQGTRQPRSQQRRRLRKTSPSAICRVVTGWRSVCLQALGPPKNCHFLLRSPRKRAGKTSPLCAALGTPSTARSPFPINPTACRNPRRQRRSEGGTRRNRIKDT